jgi:hypothetical protein
MKRAMQRLALLAIAVLAGCAGHAHPAAAPQPVASLSLLEAVEQAQPAAFGIVPESHHCEAAESANLCTALTVILDLGDLIAYMHDASCDAATTALEVYGDTHATAIDTLIHLREREPARNLRVFEDRHGDEANRVIAGALELDVRCAHDPALDRALRRLGVTGL